VQDVWTVATRNRRLCCSRVPCSVSVTAIHAGDIDRAADDYDPASAAHATMRVVNASHK